MAPAAGEVAYTVQDAASQGSSELRLGHRHLTELPAGLAGLKQLRTLDCSDNAIQLIDSGRLPAALEQLLLTGCAISAVPRSLAALTNLQQLFLSANNLSDADDISAIWHCPALLHVGISYNRISALSCPAAVLQRCPLASIDLAHNDVEHVALVAPVLSQLPKLRALGVKGNPLCLSSGARAQLLRCLPQLQYLDGQALDAPSASAPGAAAAAAAAGGSRSLAGGGPSDCPVQGGGDGGGSGAGGGAALAPVDAIELVVELTDLVVTEPVAVTVANLQRMWTQQQQQQIQPAALGDAQGAAPAPAVAAAPPSAADPGGAPEAAAVEEQSPDVAQAPVKPLLYHLEWTDAKGTSFCSLPLVLPAPGAEAAAKEAAAAAAAPLPPAGKAPPAAKAPAKAAAKGARGKPTSADGAVATAAAPARPPGSCKVHLGADASVDTRDWLRTGVQVTLVRSHWRPCRPRRAAAPPPAAAAAGAKGSPGKAAVAVAKKPSAAAGADPQGGAEPRWEWEFELEQVPLARGTVSGGGLLEGALLCGVEAHVPLLSLPRLWDDQGRRLTLQAALRQRQGLAACAARLQLLPAKPVCGGA